MPRIAGVDIPNDKRIEYSLQYIYGIGPQLARQILKEAGIDAGAKAGSLTEDEVARIAGVVSRSYVVEGQLRRQVQQNIARLKE
ncbi:MAG: 30S ribosomal protein S13, partial [Planctomycetes bacterium]|nr:30S ribosomal protein S13 [Planctomycetota bacterium]